MLKWSRGKLCVLHIEKPRTVKNNLVAQEPKPAPTAPVDEPDTVTVPETTVPEKTTAYIDDDDASWWY